MNRIVHKHLSPWAFLWSSTNVSCFFPICFQFNYSPKPWLISNQQSKIDNPLVQTNLHRDNEIILCVDKFTDCLLLLPLHTHTDIPTFCGCHLLTSRFCRCHTEMALRRLMSHVLCASSRPTIYYKNCQPGVWTHFYYRKAFSTAFTMATKYGIVEKGVPNSTSYRVFISKYFTSYIPRPFVVHNHENVSSHAANICIVRLHNEWKWLRNAIPTQVTYSIVDATSWLITASNTLCEVKKKKLYANVYMWRLCVRDKHVPLSCFR